MKKYIVPAIILVIVLALIIIGYIYLNPEQPEISQPNGDQQEDLGDRSDLIKVESPTEDQVISSPFLVKGEARGTWYFEANFPIILLDGNNNIVAEGYAEAKGDWMTEDFVDFEAEISFDSVPKTREGALILGKANPSGLPEHADAIIISVEFETFDDQAVEDMAEVWVKNNSSTYRFDGMNLELVEVRGLDLVGCENCYEVEFYFESRHAGYGDREGEMLAQVITPHAIVVLVDDGEVKSAVTDGKYNEIEGELIDLID